MKPSFAFPMEATNDIGISDRHLLRVLPPTELDGSMSRTRASAKQDDFIPFETVLRFDYTTPPITANKSYHWRAKGRLTKDIRQTTALLAKHIPPLGKCHVSLVWVVTDHRRRDGGENVSPTLKPMIDGLVDAGVVTDDTPDLLERDSPIVVWVDKKVDVAHMELTVRKIR